MNIPGNLSGLRVRLDRRQDPVNFRVAKVQWHDPYPWVPGTVPEKLVFAELMARGIAFVFQAPGFPPGQENGPHFVKRLHDIRPDFLIPSIQAAIEVQGTYFHTQPDVEQHDQDKAEEYAMWGWKVYWIFDLDIIVNAHAAVQFAPDVHGLHGLLGTYLPRAKPGTYTAPGATFADAEAVAAGNRKRARPALPVLKVRAARGRRRSRVVVDKPKVLGVKQVVTTRSVAEQRMFQRTLQAMRATPKGKPALKAKAKKGSKV